MKKAKLYIDLFSLLLIVSLSFSGLAQSGEGVFSVYAEGIQKDDETYVKLKWIFEDLDIVGGWNVYRKRADENEWKKINEKAIAYGSQKYLEEIKNNEEIAQYIEIFPEENSEFKSTYAMFMLKLIIEHDVIAQYFGLRYDDRNVEKEGIYEYKIQAVLEPEIYGVSSILNCCKKEEVSVKDFEIFSKNEDAVTIKWLPEPDSYFGVNCYRTNHNTDEVLKLNEHPILVFKYPDENNIFRYPDYFFKDTLIANDGHYSYYVKAINVFGEEGKKSSELNVNIDHHIPPELPVNIDYLIDDKQVMLNWNVDKTMKGDLKVIVERSENSKKGFQKVGEADYKSGAYIDNVDYYNWYYYRIYVRKNDNINSPMKKLQCYVTDKIDPIAPKSLTINKSGSDVYVAWDKSEEDGILGYRVFLSLKVDPETDDFSPLMDSVIENTEYVFSLDSTMESDFLVAVAAYDSFHNRSNFLISDPLVYKDVIKPEQPTLIKVEVEEDMISIDWLESHHVDVVEYRIYQQLVQDGDFTLVKTIDALEEESNAVIPIPSKSQDLLYAVTAIDDVGLESELSNVFTVNIQEDLPFEDKLDNNSIKLSFSQYDRSVKINWKNNDLKNYKGYIVHRSEDQNGFVPISGLLTESYYRDSNIKAGSTYHYYIRYYTTDHNSGKYNTESITIPSL